MRLRSRTKTTHRIAIVDDDLELLQSMQKLLERDGHEVRSAMSPDEAVELVASWSPHLILLDYYLLGGTGETVVRRVREIDELCQVLLVTGYAAEQPARRLLAELDIQGYHDKADGPQRLMVLVDAGLKHFRALRNIEQQRAKLRHILNVAPEISRIQSVPQLLELALRELGALVHGGDGFIATSNSGLFVIGAAAEQISVHAATGRFSGLTAFSQLSSSMSGIVRAAIDEDRPHATDSGYVVVPLVTRDGDRGCMIVEARELPAEAIEACEIYGRQVVQALENVLLYERATVDALTRLHTRGYGLQRLEEAVRLGARTDRPTSVVLIDIDHFKRVNDTHGHAAGDLVLRAMGAALQSACRVTDVAARHGGEEFLVVLPATDDRGAREVAERLRSTLAATRIAFEDKVLGLTASFGVATLAATTGGQRDVSGETVEALLRRADRALYHAKACGRDRVCAALEEALDASAA